MAKKQLPIKCFDGDAKPYEPFWKFVNAAESESGQTEMELYGVLSQYSWFEDDISPRKFKQDLYKFGAGGPVLLKIDSPGGDVIAASTMRTIMTDYPGEITARIDGMAASAAVIVAIAAKTVKIMDSAYMMIHDPAVVAFLAILDIQTLKGLVDSLQSIKDGIIPAYAAKTGLSEGVISNMMTRETWMSAREAVEIGFADEMLSGGQSSRQFQNLAFVNYMDFENIPPALLNLTSEEKLSAADVEREGEIKRLRDRIQTLRKE